MSAQGMAYRGADRRRAASSDALPRAVTAGSMVLVAIVIGITVLTARNIRLPADRADRIDDLARMVIPVGAGAAYATCLVRWRLTGVATVLWIAHAVLVFGIVVVGLASVALPIVLAHSAHSPWVAATRASGLLVSAALFILAELMPPVDARVRPLRLGLTVAGITSALAVVLALLPPVAGVLAFGRRSTSITADPTNLHWVAVMAVSAAIAVPYLVRGLRLRYPLMAWTGLMLVALALGDIAGVAADDPQDLWVLGHQALRAAGMLFVLIGCIADIESVFIDQRLRLFDTEITIEAAQTHRRLGLAGASRRTHDVRSALMAVEGAAVTLERHFDHLDPGDRRNLTGLLGSGVDRLRRLIGDDTSGVGRFDVGEVVGVVAAEFENQGFEIRIEVVDGVAATGWVAETAEVLRNVVSAAGEAGSAGSLTVTAVVVDDTAVVAVGRGPVPVERLPDLLAARRPPWEHGIGLHVAERLMREQGGELGVAASETGGPLFLLQLPAAGTAPPEATSGR